MLFTANRVQAPRTVRKTAASRRVSVCVRAMAQEKPSPLGKTKLMERIAAETNLSRDKASKAFDSLIGGIKEALLAGERVVTIVGFGSFNESVTAADSKTVAFKVSDVLTNEVNQPKRKAAAKRKPAGTKATAAKSKAAAAKPKAKASAAKPKAAAAKTASTKRAAKATTKATTKTTAKKAAAAGKKAACRSLRVAAKSKGRA